MDKQSFNQNYYVYSGVLSTTAPTAAIETRSGYLKVDIFVRVPNPPTAAGAVLFKVSINDSKDRIPVPTVLVSGVGSSTVAYFTLTVGDVESTNKGHLFIRKLKLFYLGADEDMAIEYSVTSSNFSLV